MEQMHLSIGITADTGSYAGLKAVLDNSYMSLLKGDTAHSNIRNRFTLIGYRTDQN